MPNIENDPSGSQVPEGERWLGMLGFAHLKGQPTGHFIDGENIPIERFDELCGVHARPIFAALESLDLNDPRREHFLQAARSALLKFMPDAQPGQ